MIINKAGQKPRKPGQVGGPIANSTVMNNTTFGSNDYSNNPNKYYFNETSDSFLNDQYNDNSAQYYQPNQQSNGFYDMQSQQAQQPPQQPISNNYNYNTNQNNFYTNNTNNMGGFGNSNQQNYKSSPPNSSHQQGQQYNQQQQQQQQQQPYFNPLQGNFLNDPVASMAVKYGSTLADQGKEYVTQNVDRWFSISTLKHYFAVDTTYVAKKLLIILFPFVNRDWSMKYTGADAVPPKLDVNAPDMYIPVMAFVTYLLMVGVSLGTQKKFSPEILGLQASSALGWFFIECLVIYISLLVLSIRSLKTFDIISFCGYKYFGMILSLLGNLLFSSDVYNFILVYMCVSLTYFMVRSLKIMILTSSNPSEETNPYENTIQGNKRRIYVLLFISLLQPFFMWFMTRHLVKAPATPKI